MRRKSSKLSHVFMFVLVKVISILHGTDKLYTAVKIVINVVFASLHAVYYMY